MAHWDVSSELRGEHGKWSKSAAMKRVIESATAGERVAPPHDFKEGDTVRYKTGSLGTVHHIDSENKIHVVWNRGRGKPVATPAHHLTHVGETPKPPAAETKKSSLADIRKGMLGLRENEPLALNGHKVTLLSNGQYEVDIKGHLGRYDYPYQAAEALHKEEHTSNAHPPRDIKEQTLRETLGAPIPKVAHPEELIISPTTQKMYGTDKQKKMRQTILAASTKQAEVTPHMVGMTKVQVTLSPHGERGTSTLASHTGGLHTLHIKPEVLVGSNAEAVRKANVGGWWVPTDDHHDLGMNVMTHEYGHGVHALAVHTGILQATKSNSTTSAAEQAFWKELAKRIDAQGSGRVNQPRVTPERRGRNEMSLAAWHSLNKEGIKQNVGKYAASNLNELVAELWTEYRLSSKPRPAAQYYGDYLTKRLKGVQA